MFRDRLSAPFSNGLGFLDSGHLKRGPICFPETSVRNRQYTLRNNPEECSSHLLRDGSLKSRTVPVSVSTFVRKYICSSTYMCVYVYVCTNMYANMYTVYKFYICVGKGLVALDVFISSYCNFPLRL
jgi:hypothetical protein